MDFKTIDPLNFDENLFKLINKDWMLLTAQKKSQPVPTINTMTISWGTMGVFWGKNIVVVGVRPERYTHEFIEDADTFSLSVFDESYRDKLAFCGSKSGRDVDKIKECGFDVLTKSDTPFFQQARVAITCKKLFKTKVESDGIIDKQAVEKWYGNPGEEGFKGYYHDLYFAEILDVLVK